MKKGILFFLLLNILLLNTSCEDTSNVFEGKWYYTSIEISGCDDPSENASQTFPGDGDCDGAMLCTKIYLEMGAENYAIKQTNTSDPLEVPTILEEGTYRISETQSSGIQFCTDLLCREVSYQINGSIITMESTELASGCNNRIIAEK